ncbi:hypothetical protein OG345_40130 [Streptomyces sp. NBC_01220]|uniref:hypothetical protein n=1 Tax=unclassified Streptomyces TaxID=2593676 RepID=UPI002E2BF913|nr:hypothetical protein [Streptomyces sp. NBC_00184]WSQ48742.1 hypothetical protein OG345_40130 [Streptomyces sp. NBC_01220]
MISPHFVQSFAGEAVEGGSAFTVSEDGTRLERRVDEILRATYDKAVESGAAKGRSASEHLRAAFSAVYGLTPNPRAAYSHAIKAVEAVAIPLFLPNSPVPTLGGVRSHLEQGRNNYEMVIADQTGAPAGIEAVVELLNLLWFGQRDRHAGGPTTRPISQEAAETAVHAAGLLVHWIATGTVRRK